MKCKIETRDHIGRENRQRVRTREDELAEQLEEQRQMMNTMASQLAQMQVSQQGNEQLHPMEQEQPNEQEQDVPAPAPQRPRLSDESSGSFLHFSL